MRICIYALSKFEAQKYQIDLIINSKLIEEKLLKYRITMSTMHYNGNRRKMYVKTFERVIGAG